jgi:glutamate formiminotransferase / formiminotetrahydrofolate cyclodeaminase
VPNFSEGRDASKVEAIIRALLTGPDVYLLDREMDADHNRSVITLVGTRESVGEAALRGIAKAAELIDLNHHQGAHPRLGSTDVVPFVPIAGVTLDDCVRIAEWVAGEAWRRFRVPTYLYEAAARRPERRNLENIRRGQFEGLREEVRSNSERRPDFGEQELHPTAGATVVGARKFLIAYNINLATPDVALARSIAKKIRASSGGFPHVKAMGVELKARNLAQVSMNLTDFETTPIGTVFDAVAREAAAHGVTVAGSEIVGLVPRRALEDAAVHYLKVENFHPELIFENRLARIIEQHARPSSPSAPIPVAAAGGDPPGRDRPAGASTPPLPSSWRGLAAGFVEALAAATPTPGGGSAAALAGALAAGLGEMVCRLTLRRSSLAVHHKTVEKHLVRLGALRERLLDNVDRDARSYEAVLAALKLPKSSEAERAARSRAVEAASREATTVPLETAELAAETARLVEALRGITISQAASDLVVALRLAEAALAGAAENVRANLPSIQDREWIGQVEAKLEKLGAAR